MSKLKTRAPRFLTVSLILASILTVCIFTFLGVYMTRRSSVTIGEVGNAEHSNIKIGKAGRKRWMGVRPTVRGTVMNPVDHPHGGGEGKNKTSGRHPVTPWGVPTKGHRTRNKKKASSRLIIRRRRK